MKKILISTLATLALSSSVYAAANTNTGCGLGSLIIRDQRWCRDPISELLP